MKKRKKSTTKSKARKPAKRKTAASGAKRRARKTTAKRRAPKTRSRKPAARKRRAPSVRRKKTTPRTAAAADASAERPRARLMRGWGRGLGAEAAGQSGDTEAIPRTEDVDSESVEELLEEGQSWEAGIVSGVEEADDEEGEVHTHEVPEDDVPEEYRDKD